MLQANQPQTVGHNCRERLEPISYELGIISNLDDLFVRKQSLLRDPDKRRRGNDICHDKLMMFSTGGLHLIPRS
jgi:hypothetical protein